MLSKWSFWSDKQPFFLSFSLVDLLASDMQGLPVILAPPPYIANCPRGVYSSWLTTKAPCFSAFNHIYRKEQISLIIITWILCSHTPRRHVACCKKTPITTSHFATQKMLPVRKRRKKIVLHQSPDFYTFIIAAVYYRFMRESRVLTFLFICVTHSAEFLNINRKQ